MSNDILIDDSSAMAGNLVAAVDSIAKAVSSSSVSFNASFDSLAKEFQTGNLKIVDAIKVMQSDLSKALNDVKINITNNYKLAQEAKKKTKKTPSTDEEKMAKLAKGIGDVFAVTFEQVQSIKKSTKKKGSKTTLDFGSEYASQADVNEKSMSAIANGLADVFSVTKEQMSAMSKSTKKSKKGEEPVDFKNTFLPQIPEAIQKINEQANAGGQAWETLFSNIKKNIEETDVSFATDIQEYIQSLADDFENALGPAIQSVDPYLLDARSNLQAFQEDLDELANAAASVVSPIVEMSDSISSLMKNAENIIKLPDTYTSPESLINPPEIYGLQEDFTNQLATQLSAVSTAITSIVSSATSAISAQASIYGVAANQSQPSASPTYNPPGSQGVYSLAQQPTWTVPPKPYVPPTYQGGQAYNVPGANTPAPLPTMTANSFYPMRSGGGPLTTIQNQLPSTTQQITQSFLGGAKSFGTALSPIFQGLAQTFGKKVSPFLANPITKAGMNLAQGGMQYAQTGNLGVAGGRASAALAGGATAALGVGLAGFGVALSAVTGAVTIAGQAIQSMSSYVAKFSPAAAERMNLVFNDLQGVIGKALLPVFEMAIPIVRQFADYVHYAMQALAPSINIVKNSFAEIIPPLIELGAVLIDAFMPVIKFAAGLIYGLTQILVPLINGFSALVETASMMAEIFSGGISITDIMINGFKLLGDITNIVVGAFNWMVAAFYAGTGSILKFASWLIDWVDGVGQGETSKALEKMGNSVIDGATKLEDAAERQMKAGLEGKKFEYKAGEIKGKGGIKSGSSVGMAVREAQSMSIESLGDSIRKAAITAQAPEQKDRQEEYMKTVSENTAYDKQKKAMLDAIKESGLVDGNETPFWDSLTEMDTDYSGGGGSFAPNGVA